MRVEVGVGVRRVVGVKVMGAVEGAIMGSVVEVAARMEAGELVTVVVIVVAMARDR